MLHTKKLSTPKEGFISVTGEVQAWVAHEGIQDGYCLVFCPHTTAGITINENSDPDVIHDLLLGLQTAFAEDRRFLHAEGNSTAHLKASAMGSSTMVPIQHGKLVLGIWQDIYFCEFDGPRHRTYHIQIIGA